MLKKTAWIFDYRPWVILFILQVPSVRNYYAASSIHYPLLTFTIVSILILGGAYLLLHNQKIQTYSAPVLRSKITTFVLLFLTIVISFFLYPRLEGIGRGGTGDDAMILPAQALFNGIGMYNVHLFDGAPVSPGPGWIAMNAIFVMTGTYGLFNTIYLGLIGFLVIWKKQKWISELNLMLLFLMLSFAVIEQIYSRQDLLAVGCGFLICVFLVEFFLDQQNFYWIGILAGLIATSRIIFIAFPILIMLIYYKKNPPVIVKFGLVSILTAIAFHLIGYFTSDFYQPLHLILNRAPDRVGLLFIVAGGLVSLVILFIALRHPGDSTKARLTWISILLFIPLFFISIGELQNGQFNLANWEAARYLLPALPVSLFAIFLPDSNIDNP